MESKASQGMARRTFLGAAAALLAGTALGLSGCGDDSTGSGSKDWTGTVDAFDGHKHTVTLTAAQLEAGEAVTLTLGGDVGHTHTLKLTQAQVQSLQKPGGMLHGLMSEPDGSHQHMVHFM